jgi:hypothetical protein
MGRWHLGGFDGLIIVVVYIDYRDFIQLLSVEHFGIQVISTSSYIL